jgi:Ca2+-binding EF-hand superfamily protein
MNRFLITAAAVFSLTSSAWAQQQPDPARTPDPQRAEQMHAKFQARMQQQFRQADKDGDGALSKAEAEAGMPRLAKHFDAIDANNDGKITQDELSAYAAKRNAQWKERAALGGHRDPQALKARFAERFKQADADGDGALSRAEAEKSMPRIVKHFDQIDANHDGKITLDEITASMEKHRAEWKQHHGEHHGPQGEKS